MNELMDRAGWFTELLACVLCRRYWTQCRNTSRGFTWSGHQTSLTCHTVRSVRTSSVKPSSSPSPHTRTKRQFLFCFRWIFHQICSRITWFNSKKSGNRNKFGEIFDSYFPFSRSVTVHIAIIHCSLQTKTNKKCLLLMWQINRTMPL